MRRLWFSLPDRPPLIAAVALPFVVASSAIAQTRPPVDSFKVVNAYPHDRSAYTQGLIYREGFLFESTGLNGQSTLRKVKLETGEVLQQHRLDSKHFGEGLAAWKGQLVQLTWQSNVAFVYDLLTFAPRQTFSYRGEGWGLTEDGKQFVLSDGTEQLRFLDPETFREIRRVTVKDGTTPIRDLNELEFVRGEIYANVWHTDRIARISPQTGQVTGWIDLRGLMSTGYRLDPEAVLNGIAYDAAANRLFVTGKLWPRLFEIKITRRGAPDARPRRTAPRLRARARSATRRFRSRSRAAY
jgi:glutamine cyclotransferase